MESDSFLVSRPRQFDLALQSLYSQSLISCSTQNLHFGFGMIPSEKPKRQFSSVVTQDVAFRGRGRPVFVPQEILDQPLRRPGSSVPPPLPPHVLSDSSFSVQRSSKLSVFDEFFIGKCVDPLTIYRVMEKYIFREAREGMDFQKMMQCLSDKALDSDKNLATICQYLYVFSQDPSIGSELRAAFFSNLEKNFEERRELKKREGPSRYRNFIWWIMAAAHHYRNLLYAPFDELMLSLLDLAEEIASFADADDIEVYCMLILRFNYYLSLPCSVGNVGSSKLKSNQLGAINKARHTVRQRLHQGDLTPQQAAWLTLLLEVTRSSPTIERDIVDYYEEILPRFALLLPEALKIKLPDGHGRSKHLEHISSYIKF